MSKHLNNVQLLKYITIETMIFS